MATRAILASTLVLSALGCAQSDVELADVVGRVTYHGEPARAEVVFTPNGEGAGGRPSSGYTDEEGQFRLEYQESVFGALLGRHRVLIKILPSNNVMKGGRASIQPVRLVELSRTVQQGTNQFQFAIIH